MPTLKVHIDVSIDSKQLYGFPLEYKATVDEFQQFDYDEPNDGDDTTFSALPLSQITTIQDLLVKAVDQAVGVRVEGGEATNVAIRLASGGIVLILGATITSSNLTANNNSGSDANLFGFGGGT